MRFKNLMGRMMLIAAVLCFILMTGASAGTDGYSFSLNSAGDGYIVTGYSGSATALTVPDWYQGLRVTEIGTGAFQGNTAIKSVSLPSTIVRIGSAAFKDCTSLSKITTYTAAENPPPMPGDADGNVKVDIYDALLVLQYDAGWNVTIDQDTADVNASGSVDASDAVLILRYCAGEDVTLK